MNYAFNFRARLFALALVLTVLGAIFSCGMPASATVPTVTVTFAVALPGTTPPATAPTAYATVTWSSTSTPAYLNVPQKPTYSATTGVLTWTLPANAQVKFQVPSAYLPINGTYALGAGPTYSLNDLIPVSSPATAPPYMLNYVLFTGSGSDLDMGVHKVTAKYFRSVGYATASLPAGAEGDLSYDTTAKTYKFFNGTSWGAFTTDTSALMPKSGGTFTGDVAMGANALSANDGSGRTASLGGGLGLTSHYDDGIGGILDAQLRYGGLTFTQGANTGALVPPATLPSGATTWTLPSVTGTLLAAETDPVFNAWKTATPPLYAEADTLATVTGRGATTTVPITIKATTPMGDINPLIFSMDSPTTNGDFNFVTGHADWNGEPDPLMFWGYNVTGPGPTVANTANSQAALYYGIEGDYKEDAVNHVLETYIQYAANNGTDIYRPFHVGVIRNTGVVNVGIHADSFILADKPNAAPAFIQIQPAATYWGTATNPSIIKFGHNGSFPIQQLNAAGTGYKSLMGLTAQDWARYGCGTVVYLDGNTQVAAANKDDYALKVVAAATATVAPLSIMNSASLPLFEVSPVGAVTTQSPSTNSGGAVLNLESNLGVATRQLSLSESNAGDMTLINYGAGYTGGKMYFDWATGVYYRDMANAYAVVFGIGPAGMSSYGGAFYNPTATTGTTSLSLRAGAGESGSTYPLAVMANNNTDGWLRVRGDGMTMVSQIATNDQVVGIDSAHVALGTGADIAFSNTTKFYNTKDAGIKRGGVGVVLFTNGSTGVGSVLASRLVEANTAVAASPNVLIAVESGTVLTNEGIAAQNYHTLPTAEAGLTFTFIVQDADGIRVVANTGDTIRIAAGVSGAAGYIQNSTIGGSITLVAINATEWVATSVIGTWTIDS